MSLTDKKLGDIVEVYCTRCRLNLDANVAAVIDGSVIKVVCRTCNNEVKYKEPVDMQAKKQKALQRLMRKHQKKREGPPVTEAPPQDGLRQLWDELTSNVDVRFARVYDAEREYDAEEVILHKKHGMGVIHDIHGDGTLNVLFRKGFQQLPSNTGGQDEETD